MIVSCLEEITLFVRKRQCFVNQLLIYKTDLRDVNGIPLPGVFSAPSITPVFIPIIVPPFKYYTHHEHNYNTAHSTINKLITNP
jgi:hypothetical protein